MNKQELVEYIAKKSGLTKTDSSRALDAFFDGIKTTLKKGGQVSLVGFGTFRVTRRAASTGRNPRTGESIKIPSSKQPKFKAGKVLKETLNK